MIILNTNMRNRTFLESRIRKCYILVLIKGACGRYCPNMIQIIACYKLPHGRRVVSECRTVTSVDYFFICGKVERTHKLNSTQRCQFVPNCLTNEKLVPTVPHWKIC